MSLGLPLLRLRRHGDHIRVLHPDHPHPRKERLWQIHSVGSAQIPALRKLPSEHPKREGLHQRPFPGLYNRRQGLRQTGFYYNTGQERPLLQINIILQRTQEGHLH